MKNIVTLFLALFISAMTFGQAGIGTTSPNASAILDLTSANRALLLPRVANTAAIATPVNGMMIYDISSNCVKSFENNTWTDCLSSVGTETSTLITANCAAPTNGITGTFTTSTALSGASYKVTITNNSFSQVSLTFANTDITLSGASAAAITRGTPTASPAFASGTTSNIASGASVTITYPLTGTPNQIGTLSATWNKTPITACVATTTINYPVGAGAFSGKTCFDIAEGNDNTSGCGPLSSRLATKSDFSQTATNTQSYVFTPSGTVSNVRFFYTNTNGTPIASISGNNTGNSISTAVTATVVYNNNLNTTAAGTTSANALSAEILVVYNDGPTNNGVDRQLKLNPKIKDCACCVVKVSATVFKEFLCHNLGADTSLDPNVPVQGIHGNYYQWGKIAPVANASTPSGAISGWSTVAAADGSWSDTVKTANDPCPAGYRVPTAAQWTGVNNNNIASRTGTWGNNATNFGVAIHFGPDSNTKMLTLPAAGSRHSFDGQVSVRASYAYYYATTISTTNAFYFVANETTNDINFSLRTFGFPIRCIAE
jgi:uncharacterized protein (TIGR02145 family)